MSTQTLAPGSSSEFVVVSSQRKRKNRPRRDKPTVSDLVERTKQDLQMTRGQPLPFVWNFLFCLVSINQYLPEIVQESSSAVHNDKCLDVLCLGLGSPCSSPNSRAQLAFLLLICKSLNIVCVPTIDIQFNIKCFFGRIAHESPYMILSSRRKICVS